MARALSVLLAATLVVGIGQVAVSADVTAVQGSAYGFYSNVGLFGGPAQTRGPAPTVTLPASGTGGPITATQPTGSAMYGPATIFSSGPLTVSTQGQIGPGGAVTTSADIDTINTSGDEPFTAANLAGSCTASESGLTGSTTVTNGTLRTSEGNPDVEGDETVVVIPTSPAPNTTYNGAMESVGDSFRYVFNQQVVNPDGSITVNAAHMYLLGPTAVGELIIGQTVCGVTGTPDTTAPKVTRTVPASKATGVSVGQNIKATFSEPMKGSSINTSTFKLFRQGSATRLPATVSYRNTTRNGILDPTNPLKRGVTYKAVVTTSALDKAGNRLDQNRTTAGRQTKTWFFTTQS